ncbi:hypothetical protein lbkm_3563 [Lachnospiraceae bacterium KM106-2]|nr:hypothetical protein lbkm_3563 [Lachnospiraceae bacterium KM106-2]
MENISKRSNAQQYFMIVIGTILMAVAINIIFDPMDMVTGGVTGIAIVVKYWTQPFVKGGVPLWITNLILNIPLFLFAILLKGRKYLAKTIVGTISLTVALYIVPSFPIGHEDMLLGSVFGGVIMGAGLGLVFANDASTGGTDLLGVIFQVKLKHYSVPQLLLILDGTIVLLGAAVFGLNKALYAVIAVYITSTVMDSILEGLKFAKAAYIISEDYDAIAEQIMTKLDRGVTGICAQGMYSNKEKKMLLCVVTKKEIVSLVDTVAQIDPHAFVIVSDVREVMGEGFIEYTQD